MLRRLGRERYVAALTDHRRLLREAFGSYGGIEVEMQGDSFHFAFSYARDAVAAAADAQRALARHGWEFEPIRVRIGLHMGEPVVQDDLYAGLDVHRAARVMSAASGGQTLLSARTADLVEGELPDDLGLRLLGSYVLKDFEQPEKLTQLEIDGLENDFGAVSAPVAVEPVARGAARGRVRSIWLAIGALSLAGVSVAAYVLLSGSPATPARVHNVAVAIDPARNAVSGRTAVGSAPTRIAVGSGRAWALNSADATLTAIDTTSGKAIRTAGTAGTPADIAFAAGSLWVLDQPNTLLRLDPDNLAPTATIRFRAPPSILGAEAHVAYGDRRLWVTARERLVRIDPNRSRVERVTTVHDMGPVAAGGGHVWVAGRGFLYELDAAGRRIMRTLSCSCGGLVFYGRWLWTVDYDADVVDLIDPGTGTLTRTIPVGKGPTGIAAGFGSVWVASEDGTVDRIDPETASVAASIPVRGTPEDVATGAGRVWVVSS